MKTFLFWLTGHLRARSARNLEAWTLFAHRARKSKKWGFLRSVDSGSARWEPYQYEREGQQERWWLNAPLGRDIGRMPKEAQK